MEFKLDMNASVDYAKKLGRLHRSALPTAVRATLNNAAFDVKKNTLEESARRNFVNREKNFFKANSTYDKATGWNVEGMKSTVGMFEGKLRDKSTNYAVKDLEQQEHGGTIKGRSFVPLTGARTSKSFKKKVTARNRISKINRVAIVNNNKSSNGKQRFIRSVIYAGKGGYILTESMLLRVDSLKRVNRKWKFKLTPLYSFQKQRTISVSKTGFMQKAAEKSAKKMPMDFKREAERQFKKYLG